MSAATSLANLRKGNGPPAGGWPGAGRPKLKADYADKQKFLEDVDRAGLIMLGLKDRSPDAVHEALKALKADPFAIELARRAFVSENDSTLQYIVSQKYGTPKSSIQFEIKHDSMFEFMASNMVALGIAGELIAKVIDATVADIKGSPHKALPVREAVQDAEFSEEE